MNCRTIEQILFKHGRGEDIASVQALDEPVLTGQAMLSRVWNKGLCIHSSEPGVVQCQPDCPKGHTLSQKDIGNQNSSEAVMIIRG